MSLLRKTASISRAEAIRRRRAEESAAHSVAVKKAVYQPVRTQPILTRGTAYGTPLREVAGNHPRRQYYYKLGTTPGAEVRSMPMPQLKVGWRAISGMLVLTLSTLIVFFLSTPAFRVGFTTIEGLQQISPLDVEAVLNLNNTPIFTVDANAIRETLAQTFPELTVVHVSIEMPASVTISAAERVPVLTWTYGDQTLAMDGTGTLYPTRTNVSTPMTVQSDNPPPILPDAGVEENGVTLEQMEPRLLQALAQLSEYLPAGTPLLYTLADGLGWQDANGWEVFVGQDLRQLNAKLTLYETISGYLVQQGIQPGMISVEYLYAPFYRSEQ